MTEWDAGAHRVAAAASQANVTSSAVTSHRVMGYTTSSSREALNACVSCGAHMTWVPAHMLNEAY